LPQELQSELQRSVHAFQEKERLNYQRKQDDLLRNLQKEEERQQQRQALQKRQESEKWIERPIARWIFGQMPLGLLLTLICSVWLLCHAFSFYGSHKLKSTGLSAQLEGLMGPLVGELTRAGFGQHASGGKEDDLKHSLFAMLYLVLCLLTTAVFFGVLTLQSWFHWLTPIVFGIAAAAGVLEIANDGSRENVMRQLPMILAAMLIIFYVSQPRVKAVFRREPGS
jgi:hypothetical protein